MDRSLQALCTQMVKLYGFISTNEYGQDVYDASPTEALCHIDGKHREVITSTGSKRSATGTVYLRDIYPWLTDQANMYVPDMADPSGFRWVEIISVDVLYDENGVYAQVVNYGEA